MDDKPILILGGYGNAGFSIADYLLQHTEKKLILAGRDADKARFSAGDLNAGYIGQGWDYRVEGVALEAGHFDAMNAACAKASLLIVATSTAEHTDTLLDAAIEQHRDALFISASPAVHAALQHRADDIQQAGICVIAQAGVFPGLPAALIRHCSPQLDAIEKISVSLLSRLDWQAAKVTDARLREMLDIGRSTAQVWRQGQWRNAQHWRGDHARVKFAGQAKAVTCIPQRLPELQGFTEQFTALKHLRSQVHQSAFMRWSINPWLKRDAAEVPDALVQRLHWGLNHFSRPPYQVQLQATLQGLTQQQHSGNYKKTVQITLSHRNAYELTGMVVAACVKQYLTGEWHQAGLVMQGLQVNTDTLWEDLQAWGVNLEVSSEVV